MDSIIHRRVEVNGIKMHIAEKGVGPVVVLLHGFPELWYTWRHQILGLAVLGFRAVAPDLRGFGDTEAPPQVADYSIFHIVGDIVALIDLLGQQQVFVVGHDWGAIVAWNLCLFRPDKVKALVNLSVAFNPWNPTMKPLQYFRSTYGDDYYICRYQEPGFAEAEFARIGVKLVHRRLLSSRSSALPSWLSEDDINYYTTKYEKTGFTSPLNYYRNMDKNWELKMPWMGMQIKVPTKFLVGDLDLTYHYPGIQDYIHKGGFKRNVPFLEEVVVMPGVSHWINQEKFSEITQHIYEFILKF